MVNGNKKKKKRLPTPTPTEEALQQSLPADIRNLSPEEVTARQSFAPTQSIPGRTTPPPAPERPRADVQTSRTGQQQTTGEFVNFQGRVIPREELPEGTAPIPVFRNRNEALLAAAQERGLAPLGRVVNPQTGETIEEPDLLNLVQQEEQGLQPSLIEQQFEAEGGFQQLEGRGERAAEGIASVGLIPSTAAFNLISDDLNQLTGGRLDIGRLKASEFAETTAGKALGITTAGVAAAGLSVAAVGMIGGAVASVTASLATSLGVSKGAIAAGGAIGAAALTGLNADIVIDKVLNRQNAQDIQSSVNTIGEMSSTITGTYQNGGYGNNPAEPLARLNQLESDLRIVEYKLQQAAVLDPRVRQSGEYIDILADIQDQRAVIQEGRATILTTTPGFNPTEIANIVGELEAIERGDREELIERGVLRTSLT